MSRSQIIVGTVLLVMVSALPVSAQYGGTVPPPQPPPVVTPAQEAGQIIETTPCSTIYVTGSNWGPGTQIVIDREFADPDCPGVGTPPDVDRTLTGGPNAQAAAGAQAQSGAAAGAQAAPAAQAGAAAQPQAFADAGEAPAPQAYTADENGNIAVPVLVPANEMGDFEVTVSGVDADGAPKQQTFSVDVIQAADFIPADDPGTATTYVAFAALLAALILAVGFNWPSLVRRVRR